MEAHQHLLVGLEDIGFSPITISLLEEVPSLIAMPGKLESAGMDTMPVGNGLHACRPRDDQAGLDCLSYG